MLQLHPLYLRTGILLCGVLLGFQTASAAVIGYWRFEDGDFLTDSNGGGDLTSSGTAPIAYALPGSGAGSDFPNPVPLNDLSNEQGASFDGSGRLRTTGVTDESFVGGRSLTFETFFNTNSTASDFGLFSLWASSSYRQASIEVNGGFLGASLKYGSTEFENDSTLSVTAGVDYYAAAVVTGNSTGDVVFYLQDLTNGGSLQTQTISFDPGGTNTDDFANVSGTVDYSLGSISGSGYLDSIMDEARVSNHAMGSEDLLMVPEPGTVTLLGLSGLALLMAARRRRN